MVGSVPSGRWMKRIVGVSLGIAAAISIPLAFRERVTADFFVQVAKHGWNATSDGQRAALDTASWYTTVFWFDLALAAVLVLVAAGVVLRAGPSSYRVAVLVAGFAAASGVWALVGDQAELHGALPVPLLAMSLTTVATLAALGSIAGWAITAPTGPRLPVSPPVPRSHQAG